MSASQNGFREGVIDLSTLPNFGSIKTVEVDIADSEPLFLIPQGRRSMAKKMDKKVLPIKVRIKKNYIV